MSTATETWDVAAEGSPFIWTIVYCCETDRQFIDVMFVVGEALRVTA